MSHHSISRRIGAAFVALSFVLVGTACGDDDDTDEPDIDEPGIEENGVDENGVDSGEGGDMTDDSGEGGDMTDDSGEGDES